MICCDKHNIFGVDYLSSDSVLYQFRVRILCRFSTHIELYDTNNILELVLYKVSFYSLEKFLNKMLYVLPLQKTRNTPRPNDLLTKLTESLLSRIKIIINNKKIYVQNRNT